MPSLARRTTALDTKSFPILGYVARQHRTLSFQHPFFRRVSFPNEYPNVPCVGRVYHDAFWRGKTWNSMERRASLLERRRRVLLISPCRIGAHVIPFLTNPVRALVQGREPDFEAKVHWWNTSGTSLCSCRQQTRPLPGKEKAS